MELTAAQLVDGLSNDNILERERAGIKLNKALSDPGEHQCSSSATYCHRPVCVALLFAKMLLDAKLSSRDWACAVPSKGMRVL